MYQVIESLLQFENGTQEVWENTFVIIPNKALVYTIDTRIIKRGDGEHTFAELPVLFDMNDAQSAQEFHDSFPYLNVEDAYKPIYLSTNGKNYTVFDLDSRTLATREDLESSLSDKAEITHNHDSDYYTLPEVSNLISSNTRTSEADEDILSYLVLAELDAQNSTKLNLNNGIADEFETTNGITLNQNFTLTDGVYSSSPSTESILVSTNSTSMSNIAEAHVLLRMASDFDLNGDILVEVSRDDGITWCAVIMDKSILSQELIEVFTGKSNFDRQFVIVAYDMSSGKIENLKGDIETFTITSSNQGYFDSNINDRIMIGSRIVFSDDSYVTVSGIINTTTVNYQGNKTNGIYQVKSISNLNMENIININSSLLATPPSSYLTSVIASVIVDNFLYAFGGFNGSYGGYGNYLFRYNINTNTWTQLSPNGTIPSKGRVGAPLCAHNNKIYIYGGTEYSTYILKNGLYCYDIATNTWSYLSNTPGVKWGHTFCVYNEKIYMYGGYTTTQRTGSGSRHMWVYDIATNTWTNDTNNYTGTRPNVPTMCDGCIVDGKLYVASDTGIGRIWSYDIAAKHWTELPVQFDLIYNTTIEHYDGCLYLTGSRTTDSIKKILVYNIEQQTSQLIESTIETEYTYSSRKDNMIYLVGGMGGIPQLGRHIIDSSYQLVPVPGFNNSSSILFDTENPYLININASNNNILCTLRVGDTYVIRTGSTWKEIVRLNGSIWQYHNGTTWVDATVNSPNTAISEAIDASASNRMTLSTLRSLSSSVLSSLEISEIGIVLNDNLSSSEITYLNTTFMEDIESPAGNVIRYRIRAAELCRLYGIRVRY